MNNVAGCLIIESGTESGTVWHLILLSICVLVPFTCCSTKLILTSKSDGPINEQTA